MANEIPSVLNRPLNPIGDMEKNAAMAVPAFAVSRFFMADIPGFGMRVAFAEQAGGPETMRPRSAVMMSLENFEEFCRTGLALVEQVRKGRN